MSKKRVKGTKRPREDLPVYQVERVVAHRDAESGGREYLLKWEGFSESANTWEPEDNLQCERLVQKYWDELGDGKKVSKGKLPAVKGDHIRETADKPKEKDGCDLGYTFENIIGCVEQKNGAREFLIKWKEKSEPEFVLMRKMNDKFPQEVIKFYESMLQFSVLSDSDED